MIVELTPDELAAFNSREGNVLKNVFCAFELLAAMKPEEAARQLDRLALPEMTTTTRNSLNMTRCGLPPGT